MYSTATGMLNSISAISVNICFDCCGWVKSFAISIRRMMQFQIKAVSINTNPNMKISSVSGNNKTKANSSVLANQVMSAVCWPMVGGLYLVLWHQLAI